MGHNRKNAYSDSTNPSEPELKDWCFLTTVSWVSKVQQQLRPGQSTGSWSQICTVWRNRMIGCSVRKLSLSSKPKVGLQPRMLQRAVQFSSVPLLSHVPLFATPWTAASQASLSITNSQSPSKALSIESMMPSNHLILCCPLLLPFNLSQHQGLFKWVSSLHQVAKVSEFQLQHQSLQWTPRTDLL